MYSFINWLRLLATVLITNSHFGNVWPVSSLATGGLLGNVIFFAASGFCLCTVKENFPRWYLRRFLRIYPVMAVFTLAVSLMGAYEIRTLSDVIRLFVYPTNYIFIVWILILYIPFYVVAYLDKRVKNFTEWALLFTAALWLLTYVIFFDKSYYHIDEVSSPFICFVYFASMLLGALFKKHGHRVKATRWYHACIMLLSYVIYFGTKIAFSRIGGVALLFQPINQITLLAALVATFAVFMGLEQRLCGVCRPISRAVGFISGITLQIYIVQFLIIYKFAELAFPLNFAVIVLVIFAAASVLYLIEYYLRKGISCLLSKRKNKTLRG